MGDKAILTPGQELGKYQILSELGRGGMGCVYLALDRKLNRRVAIKVIWHHETPDDSFVEKLALEARVIANLSHPNVVHVHAFDVIDGIPVIEMEFIEGGSLSQRFRDEFVLPSDAVRHAHGVSRALAYSHGLGAIHRDVKPSNILIDQHEQARLADFGIAKVLAESEMIALTNSRSSVFRGTPYYAPPEAWDGEEPSKSWDLYSLGAVLYEAVSGAPPHLAKTPLELAMKMATEPIQPIRDVNAKISPDLGALIDDLLRRSPADRPGSAQETVERLEALPEFNRDADHDHTTLVGRLPAKKRAYRKKQITRLVALRFIGLACLIAVFALAVIWWESATERIWLSAIDSSASSPAPEPHAPRQNLTTLTGGDRLASLLLTTRSDENQSAFDARLPEMGENMHWLVKIDDQGVPSKALSFNDARLMRLDFALAGERYAVTGNWAGYADAGGTVFRSGVVRGDVEWQDKSKVLLGTLSLINDRDGAVLVTTVTARRAEERITDVQFAFLIEESEILMPMVRHELAPRGQEWASAFDSLFPVFENGIATARLSDATDARGSSGLTLSRGARERIVSTGQSIPEDMLLGLPRNLAPILRTSVDEEVLMLKLQSTIPTDMEPVHLELEVVKDLLVPVSSSPLFRLFHYADDESTLEFYGADPPVAVPTACIARAEIIEGVATFEIAIPFDVFGINPSAPTNGDRIRVGAAIISDSANYSGETVAQWGFPSDGVAKHGAIVQFID